MRQNALRLLRGAGAVREALAASAPLAESSSSLRAASGVRALSSLTRATTQQAAPYAFAAPSAIQRHGISSSASVHMPLAEVAVDGDLQGALNEIDRIISSESVTAKEVADAAVALTYLQAKGDRRIWGKVFERAAYVKGSFDAASLTAFLWAASTAGVDHFKTIAEMAGPAAALLPKMDPTQISIVVEALGKSCTKDAELYGKISSQVVANIGKFSGADLARTLWGFAAAHAEDGAMAKAVCKALVDKAADLSGKEATQAIWALAKLRRTDKATLDALVKAAKGKLGSMESPVDAAALAWSLGFLNYKVDAATGSALAGALKAGAAQLSAAHAIDAAWGLAVLGVSDAGASKALFDVAATAVQANPSSVDVYHLGALYNAAVMTSGAKLPEQVMAFALKMYNLGGESMALKRSSAAVAFKEDLAAATAVAFGARYRPEIAKAVKGYATSTSDGIALDIGVTAEGSKIAVEPVYPGYASATHPNVLLGPAVARARLLESAGYKVVQISPADFSSLKDTKAKAAFVLEAVKGAGVNVGNLQKKLAEPFDAYA